MKLPLTSRRNAGILLVQCLVYIAVFTILSAVATGAFYVCWEQTKAISLATDDIGSALHVGERWRADVRGATGKISVASSADGESVRIPVRDGVIVYSFAAGEVRRELPATPGSQLLLSKVNASVMSVETRDGVTAWRWELELTPRHRETMLAMLFTFEAVGANHDNIP
jgi:hypothetical protein